MMKFHHLLVASTSAIAAGMAGDRGIGLVFRRFRGRRGFGNRGQHFCDLLPHRKAASRHQQLLSMTIGDADQDLLQVGEQVPTVDYLRGIRGACGSFLGVVVTAVTADNLHARTRS